MDEFLTLEIPKDIENMSLPNPALLRYYCFREERKIWLDYEIDDGALEIVKDILYFNMLDKGINVEDRIPIIIYINSPGGDLGVTEAIISAIETSKTPVYTVNINMAYSGGFYILIAGHKRFAMPWSASLIHSGSGGTAGTHEQAQSMSKQWEFEIKRLLNYVIDNTSIDKRVMSKKKSTEWYINGEEQLNLGIVDSMVEDIDSIM